MSAVSVRRVAANVWGAHACRVLVAAFCGDELPLWTIDGERSHRLMTFSIKVRFGRMPQPARYKRALLRRIAHAFTIIELLIVMAIILLLAGLILSTSSYVQKKGYRSRAEAEIAAMSAALESYKADNGIYPSDAAKTDAANPATDFSGIAYTSASLYLYEQLFGASSGSRTATAGAKTYFSFKPNMLNPSPPSVAPVTSLRDPFGNPYAYSTAKAATPAGSIGTNPTYDLWSVGDGAPGTDQTKWIKNW